MRPGDQSVKVGGIKGTMFLPLTDGSRGNCVVFCSLIMRIKDCVGLPQTAAIDSSLLGY